MSENGHNFEESKQSPAAWIASSEYLEATNVMWLMRRVGVDSYKQLHAWSVRNREAYWGLAIERIGLRFQQPFDRVLDLTRGIEEPCWLPGARFNIVGSCFSAPVDSPAIVYQAEGGQIQVDRKSTRLNSSHG